MAFRAQLALLRRGCRPQSVLGRPRCLATVSDGAQYAISSWLVLICDKLTHYLTDLMMLSSSEAVMLDLKHAQRQLALELAPHWSRPRS